MPATLPMLPDVGELDDPPARPFRLSSCMADVAPDATVREMAIRARTVFMTLAPEFRGPKGINLRTLDGCMRQRPQRLCAGYARMFHPRQVPALPSIRPLVFATLVGAASAAMGAGITVHTPRVERTDAP